MKNPQAESQEPVALMYVNFDDECEQIEYGEPFDNPSVTPLYAALPARQWVGAKNKKTIMAGMKCTTAFKKL